MTAAPTEEEWLAAIHAATLRGDWHAADSLCLRACQAFGHSPALQRLQAGVCQQLGRIAEAEALLRQLLARQAEDDASAFSLARLLGQQGRTAAAAGVLRACFASARNRQHADLAINAIELLDDYGRTADAAAIALDAVALAPQDARLHAYSGMLQMQLGEFDSARAHYCRALALDARAWEWHIPLGLANAQRYADDRHSDFELFSAGLQRTELSPAARAELHFALGKANDDIGRYGEAVHHLREGNRVMHALARWPRKEWRRMVNARLASPADSRPHSRKADFVPVFIVGMPRSGTTLLATLLATLSNRICARGELDWIERIARQINPNTLADYSTADL